MICSICSSAVKPHCEAKVLGKYIVQYYRCTSCQFIFTETPYWLNEAYNSAITKLDIGLIQRNQLMTPIVSAVINKWFNPKAKFIDYGGGYGMLVRMMRDAGYDFYRQDLHCVNLYAELFDIRDVKPFRAELLTAFEVMEHLVDPQQELEKMLTLSDSILFSTTIQPSDDVLPDSWWYFVPETGQHVSLYSHNSLKILATNFGLNYYWNSQNIHLFTKKTITNKLFQLITHPRLSSLYNLYKGNQKSLLQVDYEKVQADLKSLVK